MYNAVSQNKRNTVLIMAVFVAIIGIIGVFIGIVADSYSLSLIIFICAILYAWLQYFIAGKLAMAMTGAQEIEKNDAPELWRVVENLAITSGMPMPKVYIIDDPAPNAFATGRDPKHAIVGATTGLLEIMDKRELEAVMAHEMSHVRNYDIRVSMIAFGLVSAIGLFADLALRMMFYSDDRDREVSPIVYALGLVVVILAPILATITQLAVSRQREYLADASGVLLTRDTEGLASALEKLRQFGRPMQKQSSSTANLFMNNPLKPGFFSKLFSTHPPLEDRITRLRNNATKM
ncbi:protease [Candidatus Nanosynbacter lyticus]|uniref:Protease HtpX homolog n=1 Tax=Candidatus Nanosynbacter lyticus TaxID=2093824 RepID=A0A6S4GRB4_9BACT|nr:zinc metalloprotease HtpX [Candidatus Nanosynbacter lyticus]AJA06560.1 protease [Candidatus Nanosynbacter lyticus]QCT41662.1 zinc metalloprotease HtpX [TM7 phylum sp. oral taxon 952]